MPVGIPLQRDAPRACGRVPDVVEPERAARRRVLQRAHDGVPGFAAGVAAEQQDLVEHVAVAVEPLPEGGVLAEFHVVGWCVLDDRAALAVRALRVVAMGQVRGREEDVSRAATVSPDYEPLDCDRRLKTRETSLLGEFIRTRRAVAVAQVREGFMVLGS